MVGRMLEDSDDLSVYFAVAAGKYEMSLHAYLGRMTPTYESRLLFCR